MTPSIVEGRRVGVALVGLGGAVATTAVAGIELLRSGHAGTVGLPLAQAPADAVRELVSYESLYFGGWDLCPDDLARSARTHGVLSAEQVALAASLSAIKPWPGVGNAAFCPNVGGPHRARTSGHRAAVRRIKRQINSFRRENNYDAVVVINLASTERHVDRSLPVFATLAAFEAGLDANAPEISPSMLYAYSAIGAGAPYANFTPSLAADVPALTEYALKMRVPVAGKDGKTGQTMMKTVIAPALRARNLLVLGWYSTNILGNRDGLALIDSATREAKLLTKRSVLDQMLGYEVVDHLVDIHYYPPRGDDKEAWDNIDITGFLGERMQLKVNFLCKDSILAAPLVVELARLLDLAQRRGERGVQEQLSFFFKLPMTAAPGAEPQHALHRQERMLFDWLAYPKPHQAVAVDAGRGRANGKGRGENGGRGGDARTLLVASHTR